MVISLTFHVCGGSDSFLWHNKVQSKLRGQSPNESKVEPALSWRMSEDVC